ncbi:probable ADP-ribosylation factor GTPase-activating protein agd14 [Phtheirospermum japonicum]|uniref:Probable ADP-ribosylation factor GTPase-activating protein agd14 n=1 Tax=Phtheirospermum japonicum TaxID=374723 RepID=A0A830DCT5_9LAMI|nr:probable ADP-ribosylation factor GTPase-activating protein agd14 [Phtheirospermum japonicum]
MPRRVKDEERVEMIIRGLLKQPENRRCVNCNSLGPQYVCTTFWTFVCTICSGVHREFTHRVKSVSMAKFNDEEISALQAGGNERAKEIYFKAWDPQRNSYPDGGNLHSLREFVRHVYIDRKYAGENKNIAMVKLNSYSDRRSYEKSDFFERQFSEISNSSRDDLTDRCSFDQSSPFKRNGVITFRDILEERSPRSSHESAKSSGSQRHRPTTRFEIVDDRFRDDGSVKRYDHRYSSSRSGGSRSPVSQTDAPANARPVLKIEGPPKYSEKVSLFFLIVFE